MAPRSSPRPLAALAFAATIGVGACLLFQVQFILGKQILPWFGGAPAVWTTCMLFFQVLLLLGYGYAHLVGSRPSAVFQRNVHLAALLLATALLLARVLLWPSPITPSDAWKPAEGEIPSLAILGLLLFTIGLPFLVLSSTGPLLQSWYARCFPGSSPYRLYALSNLGSLLGLLSYPFGLEPLLSVTEQGWVWSAGFLAFAVGCASTAALVGRTAPEPTKGSTTPSTSDEGPARPSSEDPEAPPTARARALWLCLAMLASVLLLAITSQISLEVAVIPFLWMLPLALYLLSFVLCFEYERVYRRGIWVPLLLVSTACTTVVIHLGVGAPMLVQLFTYLSTLFFACMVCHGELVRRKPAPRHLTGFYLLVSAGGAAGGVFTGIVAPAAFPDLWELPLALVAVCILALFLSLSPPSSPPRAPAPAPSKARAKLISRLRIARRGAAGLGAVFVLAIALALVHHAHEQLDDNLHVSRGFFGVLRVDQDWKEDHRRTRLRHGRIIHGFQYEEGEWSHEPTSYYGPGSGVGLAINTHPRRTAKQPLRVGVVGLGTGTLASYAVAGDEVLYYEIDPDVLALSSGAQPYFTYLRDCPGTAEVLIGDARITLEREPDRGFDVLALDAFSSDAIPAHLLTVEAVELYLRHLRDDSSVIAVHISNRYLDLDPVVRGLAEALDLAVIRIDDDQDDALVYTSEWMLLARDAAAFEGVTALADPTEIPEHEGPWPRWTDSYSNLVQVLE